MPLLAPPMPPLRVALADDDSTQFWLRHWLLVWTGLTILVTAWFISLGPIPGILALLVAKDILVALLAAGLGLAQPRTRALPRPWGQGSEEGIFAAQATISSPSPTTYTRHKPGVTKKLGDAY